MVDTPDKHIPEAVFCGKSDIGLKRPKNEDAFILDSERGFFLVADGMGGAAAGELASRIFAETTLEVFAGSGGRSEKETLGWVQKAFSLANERILKHVTENPGHKGMGCTAELLALSASGFVLGHMGDSRTYRFRNGQLRQLTQDHSLVQDQVDRGLITPAEAQKHPLRNVILRAVGIKESLALDIVRGRMFRGDLFLLCSDGLTDMVSDSIIQEVLSSATALPQKVDQLIERAKSVGGVDNITVVLYKEDK